ncbi:phage tail sheath C-terminal domain-containing protein [Shimia ponticola]|uniref:phage tail sheath C-terminal domain-containing protein n=1 Tax=Shimia ponticola TaxID=2582893 RepID=UPI0011BD715B|nr:phage tail sheath C-terminal domain-containing protein [Shimia ponticola]
MYQHPGVYVEHVPSGALAIEAASTSVTAFVGPVGRGSAATVKPIFITSVGQYASAFGPLGGGAGGIYNQGDQVDVMGHAINAYFANGGTKAYIVPLDTSDEVAATIEAKVKVDGDTYDVSATAKSPGTWGNDLKVKVEAGAAAPEVTISVLYKDKTVETYTNLTLAPDEANSAADVVTAESGLVTLEAAKKVSGGTLPATLTLATGKNSTKLTNVEYGLAFDVLKDYRDISIICLPGLTWNANQTTYQKAIAHAEFMKNRMVIVDPNDTDLKTATDVNALGLTTSPFAATYHPHLTVLNPYHNESAASLPKTFDLGPGAFAAGLWGRIDSTRGVWKAPGGLEATVRGTLGPKRLIGNAIQDNLNPEGVNCIRSIVGPNVVWGARTRATKTKPEFRYISVRRTQNMIGESLYRALQAVVFEPNDHKLWSALRGGVGDFMDGLHRAGAFQGAKASDAYFVQCGLGSTMTQGDIDAGIVRVSVGFAPLKPAEFVVVQISQKVGQAA